jgi:hypothetical protein
VNNFFGYFFLNFKISHFDPTEIARFNNFQTLFGNCDFSQVFVLEIGVDLCFLSVLVIFKVQLGNINFSVSNSLLFISISFVDFILSCD